MRIAQRVIDSREFSEWIAYDRLEPIYPYTDLLVTLAQSNWLFAEANRDRKKKPTGYNIEQFLPLFMKPPKKDLKGEELADLLWNKMSVIAAMWDN